MVQKLFREEIHIKGWRAKKKIKHFTYATFKSF